MKLSVPVMILPVILGFAFAFSARPQTGHSAVPVSTDVPVLPPDVKLKIRDEQHKIDALQIQYDQANQVIQNLQKQYGVEQESLNNLVEEAYKSAKADKKSFALDLEKLEFTKVEKKAADPVLPPQPPA